MPTVLGMLVTGIIVLAIGLFAYGRFDGALKYVGVLVATAGAELIVLQIPGTSGWLVTLRTFMVILVVVIAGSLVFKAGGLIAKLFGSALIVIGLVACFNSLPESWQAGLSSGFWAAVNALGIAGSTVEENVTG